MADSDPCSTIRDFALRHVFDRIESESNEWRLPAFVEELDSPVDGDREPIPIRAWKFDANGWREIGTAEARHASENRYSSGGRIYQHLLCAFYVSTSDRHFDFDYAVGPVDGKSWSFLIEGESDSFQLKIIRRRLF